jgi:hypothetical protein
MVQDQASKEDEVLFSMIDGPYIPRHRLQQVDRRYRHG